MFRLFLSNDIHGSRSVLFRSNPKDPKIVKIVDHTLFNALKVLIDADELAASGEPPEWVSNFLGS